MICERTHENILKHWGKSFPKKLEMPAGEVFISIKGPYFTKDQ